MAGSTIGSVFRVTTWGESHGAGVGAVIDGCPAGLRVDEGFIRSYMERRSSMRPGCSGRREEDRVIIDSGVFQGVTLGTPISLAIANNDKRSSDYNNIATIYRPSHADYTYEQKYGLRDFRGGGRSSGRETAARVAAGAIASQLLREMGVNLTSYTRSIGPYTVDYSNCKVGNILRDPYFMPDAVTSEKVAAYLDKIAKAGDSVGGCVECVVGGLPAGLGEPVFDKLDAELAKAIMSIGAVKGIDIGIGRDSSFLTGSQNNDGFMATVDGRIKKTTNRSGGTLGGMSDGAELIVRAFIKPTPSISIPQNTVDESGNNTTITISGRHDTVIVPKAVVVVEAMTAIVLADMMLRNMASRLTDVKDFYSNRPALKG